MKQYGFNMATEFTKKQVNVIYALNKQGKLNVPDEAIKEFYNLADYYGYDYNRSITDREQIILLTLEAIFANDLEEAQRKIDLYKSLYLGIEECEEAEEVKEAEKVLYDELEMDITSAHNDKEHDFLTEHKVNGRHLLHYFDGVKEGAVDILTGEVITDDSELSILGIY